MSTYSKLKAEISKLEKEADALLKQETDKAIEHVRGLVNRYGLTAEQLGFGKTVTARKGKKPGKPGKPAKYMDPATGNKWNGLGKRPRWIAAAWPDVSRFLIANQGSQPAAPDSAASDQGAISTPTDKKSPAKAAKTAGVKKTAVTAPAKKAASKTAAAKKMT